MAKIIVEYETITVTVEEKDGRITVFLNGKQDDELKNLLDGLAVYSPPMGGTFYTEPGTMLAYYNLYTHGDLSHDNAKVTVEGDIGEMPCENGLIY